MSSFRLSFIVLSLIACLHVHAQSDTAATVTQLSNKYFSTINKKVDRYQERLTSKTEKTLTKLCHWETKVQAVLQKASPDAARRLFANKDLTFAGLLEKYQQQKQTLVKATSKYDAYRDKLTSTVKYAESQKAALDSGDWKTAANTLGKVEGLNINVAATESVEELIRQRKKALMQEMMRLGLKNKYLGKINKEAYYYSETVKNYREIFSDPAKVEEKAKEALEKIPAFREFARKNSFLASLFKISGDGAATASLSGLQTRTGVNSIIQSRLAAGGPNAAQVFSQKMDATQAEMDGLKNKLMQAGGNGNADMPVFKPNMQKTKTFWQRVEYGANVQFSKNSSLLPSTADLALTIGYKLNDRLSSGLGLAYKIGMGSINKIRITHEGVGLRSYADWKLKKQLFLSVGYEMNYNASFKKISQLQDMAAWQRSGLIGLSKKVPGKGKRKAMKLSLLFDYLHDTHQPQTPAFVYRVGYNF